MLTTRRGRKGPSMASSLALLVIVVCAISSFAEASNSTGGMSAKDEEALAGGFAFLLCFGLMASGAVMMATRPSPMLPIAMVVTALAIVGLILHTVITYDTYEGPPAPATCGLSTCKPKCGDGTRWGSEVCDDGKPASFDGCSDKCKVECGYTCTGGSTTAPDVCTATCGDGILAFGAETCDDGNTADGDGCSATCAVESTHVCTDKNCTKSTCKPKCGDGTRFASEVCDDGMPSSGDGCSDKCTVECGWTCEGGSTTAPDVCTATCGDGMTVGAEACDDGNTADGDGCSATCTKESTHECKLPDPGFKWTYWMSVVLVSCVVVLTWAAVFVQYMLAGKQDKTTPLPSTKSDTTTPVESTSNDAA